MSHRYGIKPWELELLTPAEIVAYVDDLSEYNKEMRRQNAEAERQSARAKRKR